MEDFGCAHFLGYGQKIRSVTGDCDDGKFGEACAEAGNNFQAVLLGHEDVGDDQFDGVAEELLEAFSAFCGGEGLVAGGAECLFEEVPGVRVVIDDQDSGHWKKVSFEFVLHAGRKVKGRLQVWVEGSSRTNGLRVQAQELLCSEGEF